MMSNRFAEIRQNILETAKRLVDNTSVLVNSTSSSQECLANAAKQAIATISMEVDYVKLGAAVLVSDTTEGQVRRGKRVFVRKRFLETSCLSAAVVGGC